MAKLENLIQEPLKERLKEVTSKPKRRRMKASIIASTEDHRMEVCKELRYYENKEKQDTKCIPVLFMFGQPQRRLSKDEATEYINLGAKVEYMTPQEAKLIK